MSVEPDAETIEGTFPRESRGLEFDRVSFFSDAIYAIAMTLLVVDIHIPRLTGITDDPSLVIENLRDNVSEIVGFFLCFWLVGQTWINHHRFIASLRMIGRQLIALNMIYLAFVAFTPYPVAMISHYENNLASFMLFAANLLVLNLLELAMFVVAYRLQRTGRLVTEEVFRFGVTSGLIAVAVVLFSVPMAMIHTTWGLVFLFMVFPIHHVRRHFALPEVHRYLRTGG